MALVFKWDKNHSRPASFFSFIPINLSLFVPQAPLLGTHISRPIEPRLSHDRVRPLDAGAQTHERRGPKDGPDDELGRHDLHAGALEPPALHLRDPDETRCGQGH